MEKKLACLLEEVSKTRMRESSFRVFLHLISLPGNSLTFRVLNQTEMSKSIGIKITATWLGLKDLCKYGFMEKKGKGMNAEYRILANPGRKTTAA